MTIEEKKEKLHRLKRELEKLEKLYLVVCDEILTKKSIKDTTNQDIATLKEAIQEVENQIEEEESKKSECKIYRIKPMTNDRLFIELYDPELKHRAAQTGFLHWEDIGYIDFELHKAYVSIDGTILYIPRNAPFTSELFFTASALRDIIRKN